MHTSYKNTSYLQYYTADRPLHLHTNQPRVVTNTAPLGHAQTGQLLQNKHHWKISDGMQITTLYSSSASEQDETNPAPWLATRAGKMELSCPLGTTRRVPQEKFPRNPYNKSFIDQACSVKMAGYWPRSFFASLWTSTPSRSINSQEKNLANIQPSWPHTWSITHTYSAQVLLFMTCRYGMGNCPALG